MSDALRMGSGEMFDQIAERYDRLNRIISLGIDQAWRRKMVSSLQLENAGPCEVLDLATGTADVAIQVVSTAGIDAKVVGLDPSKGMLAVGQTKVDAAGLQTVELVCGDAEALPFEDDRFDGITIAFGIRNVPDRAKALREMARVTKPEGRVAILELGEPKGGLLGPLARFHIRHVVPWLGALLSGSKEYRYLQKSVGAFPEPEDFASLMEESGLEMVDLHKLTFGVCNLYVAKPKAVA
jgi:demethylmenaquinone methyltransferase/2-methoxy-6-polyprenyl-1,4-benzoquinol methylase